MSLCNMIYKKEKCSTALNPICIAKQTNIEVDGILQINEIQEYSYFLSEQSLISRKNYRNILQKKEYEVVMKDNGLVTCYALMINKSEPMSISKQVFRKKKVTVIVDTFMSNTECCKKRNDPTYDFPELVRKFESFLYNVKVENTYNIPTSIKPVAINLMNSNVMNVTLHVTVYLNETLNISTKVDNMNYDAAQDMFAVNFVDAFCAYEYNVKAKSARFCTEITSSCGAVITFTEIGHVGHTIDFCFETEGASCSRLCQGDFIHGASWNKEIAAECTNNHSISAYNHSTSSALKNLKAEITQIRGNQISNAILHSICSKLRTISSHASDVFQHDIEILADIVDILMSFLQKFNTKIESCTDVVLSVEKIMNSAYTDKGMIQILRQNFAAVLLNSLITDTNTQIIGAAFLKKKRNGNYVNINTFNQGTFKVLNNDQNLTAVLKMKPDIAVALPADIMKEQTVMFAFYRDQSTFGVSQNHRVPVVDISVKEKKQNNIYRGIYIIFDRRNTERNGSCVFWDYEENNGLGNWSSTGCELLSSEEHVDVCVCNHLTSFTKLIYGKQEEISDTDLDIITVIGCSLSLLGYLGITITALLFPEWRKGVGRKVLFNLSSAVGLMTALVLVNTLMDVLELLNADIPCIIIGVLMHFSVLASFCWMFLAACLQYFRLVHVFSRVLRESHLVLKSSLIGWVLPLIPCCILLFIDVNLYGPEHYCYPNGYALYFGIILPIVCIILCNVSAFLLIVYSLIAQGKETMRKIGKSQTNDVRVKVKAILFLFILFGLTWIFGFIKFNYLFCITSSLQGFMFFIFFIVLDDNVRNNWKRMISRKKKKLELTTTSMKFSESSDQN